MLLRQSKLKMAVTARQVSHHVVHERYVELISGGNDISPLRASQIRLKVTEHKESKFLVNTSYSQSN